MLKGEDVDYTNRMVFILLVPLKSSRSFLDTACVRQVFKITHRRVRVFLNPEQLKIYVIRVKLQSTPILLLGYGPGLGGIC